MSVVTKRDTTSASAKFGGKFAGKLGATTSVIPSRSVERGSLTGS